MDENNFMNYNCEPVQEPEKAEPERISYSAYQPHQGTEKPAKAKGRTWKLLLLVVAVAIVGSIGGALLTMAVDNLRDRNEQQMEEQAAVPEETKPVEEEPEDAYELVKNELPEKLNSNDTGKALDPAAVYELAVHSVVGINTEVTTNVFGQEAVTASAGSGFILSEDGYIITNCHVVDGADTIKVTLFSGEIYPATLVGADSSFDIALLKIEAEGLPAVSVGDSDQLRVGEEVVAIGNPLGELTFTMTNGILSALDREINTDGNPQNMLQTNAAINSGNSGGPLFDMDGNVIGVTTAKYSGSSSSGITIEGLGFAIPINAALKVAYDLAEYGYVRGQAFLGISVRTLDSETASYYSLPVGPRVESVTEGSCSEKAGLKVGDIILEFNGRTTTNNTKLKSAVKKAKAGDTVTVKIFRAGAELELEITLDERPKTVEQPEQQPTVSQEKNTVPENEYQFVIPGSPYASAG